MNSRQLLIKTCQLLTLSTAILVCICQSANGYQSTTRKESADPYFKPTKTSVPAKTPDKLGPEKKPQRESPKGPHPKTISFPATNPNNGSIIREHSHGTNKNGKRGKSTHTDKNSDITTTPWGRHQSLSPPKLRTAQRQQNPKTTPLNPLATSALSSRPEGSTGFESRQLPAFPPAVTTEKSTTKNKFVEPLTGTGSSLSHSDNDFRPNPMASHKPMASPNSMGSPNSVGTTTDSKQSGKRPANSTENAPHRSTNQFHSSESKTEGKTEEESSTERAPTRLDDNKSDSEPAAMKSAPAADEEADEHEAFEPGRVLALVGGEPIFVGDILFDVNQIIQKFAPNAPESVREKQRPDLIKRMLPKFIDSKLLYVATVQGLPDEANVEKILEQADTEFDEKALETFMKQMDVETTAEFDAHLRLMGSSLRNLRRSWSKEQLVRYFLSQQLNIDTAVSHQELLDYYREHESDYITKPRAKWEQVMVRFDKYSTRDEARKAIVEIGNKIVYGAKLKAIALQSSHGFRADEGGQHDWTSKGALVRKEVDSALFELPIGTLSEIIESRDGFHIVRVTERDETTKKSFLDAQVEIKEKLGNQKREVAFQEHLAKLKEEIPVEIFEVDDEKQKAGKRYTLGQ